MKNNLVKLMMVATVLSLAVACGKKSSDGASVNGRDRVSAPGIVPMGQGSPGAIAQININAAQGMQIRQIVQQLVSPNISDGNAVGEIRSIEVSGKIYFQQNGQIQNQSVFQIVIKDSYVGTTEDGTYVEPIVIVVGNGTGSLMPSQMGGQANLTFSDSYGTITVTGPYQNNGGQFTGTVSFRNNNGTSGTLGSFTIPTCSFFACQQQY